MRPGPPTIVHVMGWRSQQYGSFERFLVALSRAIDRRGGRLHLVFPAPPASSAFVADARATFHVLPSPRHPADLAFARRLGRLLRATGARWLHAHFGVDSYHALAVAPLAGVPHRFATKHITPGRSRLTASRTRHRALAALVDRLFAVSGRVAEDLVELGVPRAKVEVVVLGVDADAYRPDPERRARARAALGLAPDQVAVLSTSHLRPGKGVELLPELARALRDHESRVVVLAAGDGPLREPLAGRARALDLGPDALRLLGVREDVPDLLAAADVYVFPTIGNEGLPLAPLEALAAGVPVVASAVSDLPQLLAGAAELVPPGDAGALVAACRRLVRDPDARADLARRGRERAVERLHVDAAAHRHVERYGLDGR